MSFNYMVVEEEQNTKKVKFIIDNQINKDISYSAPDTVRISSTWASAYQVVCNTAVFQVKIVSQLCYEPNLSRKYTSYGLVFIKFTSIRSDDPLSYILNISCEKWSIANKKFISDEGTWHFIGETTDLKYSFTITAELKLTPTNNILTHLYYDNDLTDFEFKCEGGSVKMHRAVLTGASPVLRRMLSGPWREAAEGSVDLGSDTSVTTLNHLKEYIYLQKLPDAGIEQLLILAHYYMMSKLKSKCIFQLLSSMTAQNAYELIEFGTKCGIPDLVLAILDCVERGILQVKDLRSQLRQNDC